MDLAGRNRARRRLWFCNGGAHPVGAALDLRQARAAPTWLLQRRDEGARRRRGWQGNRRSSIVAWHGGWRRSEEKEERDETGRRTREETGRRTRLEEREIETVKGKVTKDGFPVVFHDDFILTQVQGEIVEKRVTDLTLDEFLSYGPQKQPGKEGKPLFKRTKEGRIVEWIVEHDDPLCTLEEAFENVSQTIGFDIELKFDDIIIYKEEELKHAVQVVLNVVHKHAKQRPVFFSSFHPDAAMFMKQLQGSYPVFFITKGGTEIYNDPRRNSLEAAINHCLAAGLQGIVSEVKAIFKNPGMVAKIKECKLTLLTYGQLNNVPEAVYLQHIMGVDGVVVDFVREITEAVSRFLLKSTTGEVQENHKPEFSEKELSFLLKLIPELMQT